MFGYVLVYIFGIFSAWLRHRVLYGPRPIDKLKISLSSFFWPWTRVVPGPPHRWDQNDQPRHGAAMSHFILDTILWQIIAVYINNISQIYKIY